MTTGATSPREARDEFTCPKCRQTKKGKRWTIQGRGSSKEWKGICTECRAALSGERPRPPDPEDLKEDRDPMVGGTGVDDPHWTDWGNAKRLVARFGEDVRYCHPRKSWFVWNGRFWERDEDGRIYSMAKDVVRAIYSEASRIEDDAQRKALTSHALFSEGEVRLRAMVTLATTEPGIAIQPGELDVGPWLFNCQNGTIDLRTGELRGHNKADLITKLSPAEYHPDAESELWSSCLNRWMNGDRAMVGFLRRAAGYTLTGDVGEECMFVLHGSGRNGKGKFVGALQHVMGEYAKGMTPDSLLTSRGGGERSTNDIASLVGIRFAPTTETDQGRRFAEGLVKYYRDLGDMEGLGSYLARYVRHPPIGESRILGYDEEGVRIRYEWDNEVHETMVTTEAFVRSLLSNIPPKGFHVVRWYGLYSPTYRRWARWMMCGISTVPTRLEAYINVLSGDEKRCLDCGGVMEPMAMEYVRNGRWELILF